MAAVDKAVGLVGARPPCGGLDRFEPGDDDVADGLAAIWKWEALFVLCHRLAELVGYVGVGVSVNPFSLPFPVDPPEIKNCPIALVLLSLWDASFPLPRAISFSFRDYLAWLDGDAGSNRRLQRSRGRLGRSGGACIGRGSGRAGRG